MKIKIPKQARINAKNSLKNRLKFKKPPMTAVGVNSAKQISKGEISKNKEISRF